MSMYVRCVIKCFLIDAVCWISYIYSLFLDCSLLFRDESPTFSSYIGRRCSFLARPRRFGGQVEYLGT